jgi:hypothetical protein
MQTAILGPVVGLVVWTFVMWAWLYATRIPAMIRLKMRYDPRQPNAVFTGAFPPQVRWKADNYNHLMEQPTLFYAVCLTLAVAGAGEGAVAVALAWAYVAIRGAHSLVQALVNKVLWRFGLFMAGSVVLLGLTAIAAVAVF